LSLAPLPAAGQLTSYPASAVYLELLMRQSMMIQQQIASLQDSHAALVAYQNAYMQAMAAGQNQAPNAPASVPAVQSSTSSS
jgi:hypothetical protein